jgi:glyoxylase-like metal-dependent hydrolase (beta-lactamase superfamily II)
MMSPYSDVAFTRCGPQPISPLVWRWVARDAAPRGFQGLRTYLVGHGEIAVIDPDPASRPLLDSILTAAEGERITHVLITNSHGRRSPLALELAERTGARVLAAHAGLEDGMLIRGGGFTLEAIATPGHGQGHFGFALKQENALFCGDLVSGWSPGVAMPPGGDLSDHLASLETVRRRGFSALLPAHGPPVTEVGPFLADCLEHSRRRERQVLDTLTEMGPCTAWELAGRICPKVHGLVQPGAAHAILAHLSRLAAHGRLQADGRPSLYARFALVARPQAEAA